MQVRVSRHAQQRLADRCVDRRQSMVVAAEVEAAVVEGRMAKRPPSWCLGRNGKRARGKNEGHYRYVWPPQEDRIYYLARIPEGWLVVTVLIP